jgi:hypothetical protein
MLNRTRRLVGGAVLAVAVMGSATTAIAAPPALQPAVSADSGSASGADRGCSRQFDTAVGQYVETTDRRDARGFNALLDRDVTIMFANGGVLYGKAQSANFITSFFADPGWTQTFRELTRHVEGCRTGFVLFDSVYSVPAQNRVVPLVIGVTFTRDHGHWLVLHNQDSNGPAS